MAEANGYRICVVITSFTEGIINLVNTVSPKHEVHLIYIASPVSIKDAERISESCYVHAIRYPYKAHSLAELGIIQSLGYIRLFWDMLLEIRKVVKNYHIDLIHAHWTIPCGFLASLSTRSIPLITEIHGSDIKVFGKRRLFKYPIKYALRRSAGIIAVSKDLKQEAMRLGAIRDRIHVIPGRVNTNRFKPVDKNLARSGLNLPDGFLVLFVGNLIKLKRVDKLIEVVSRLSQDTDCHLLIAGDGPERTALEDLAGRLRLKNIIFTGRIPNDSMHLYMAASDVLVLYSKSEGLPQCVQEAMACGIPVVASNVGGIPDIVSHGVNGYLANDEAELERYLRELMTSPELVSAMGANALQFARQNLSSVRAIEQIGDLYTSILDKWRHG